MAVVVIIYTTAGGIVAVAYTDVAQLCLMDLLILGLLSLAIIEAGGFSNIFTTVPPKNLTIFAPGNDVLLASLLALLVVSKLNRMQATALGTVN